MTRADRDALRQWAYMHNVDPSRTPLGGVHTFGPFVVIEQFPPGPRRLNRRGTDAKRTWPKIRRLRAPLPELVNAQ